MFILRNLLFASANLLDMALTLYTFVIVARAVISWVNPDPWNPIVQFLYRITEPVLAPIRKRIPIPGIDLSPIVVIFAIMFFQSAVVASLRDLARTF
jgi:YggT family protein